MTKKCVLFDSIPLILQLASAHHLWYSSISRERGLCAFRHGIQVSMEAILACHPARSTEWLDCHPKSCELWRIRTGIMRYTAWCSEIGSLTSPDARNSGASSDRREPISLHQAVYSLHEHFFIMLLHPRANCDAFHWHAVILQNFDRLKFWQRAITPIDWFSGV